MDEEFFDIPTIISGSISKGLYDNLTNVEFAAALSRSMAALDSVEERNHRYISAVETSVLLHIESSDDSCSLFFSCRPHIWALSSQ